MCDPKYIESWEGAGGEINHFVNGEYIGTSMPTGVPGSKITIGADGSMIGTTFEGGAGELIHVNNSGEIVGTSWPGGGSMNHFRADGTYAGSSFDNGVSQSTWLNDNVMNDDHDDW